jgi:hypothetical protein
MRIHTTILTASLALATAVLPLAARAQQTAPADSPSYARPSYGSDEETVRGRIASFDGAYALQLRDDRGFIDNVHLQPGTVINPTGIRLEPGMSVTIYGSNGGSYLAAHEIDTAYRSYGAVYPVYPYPYPAYVYPYEPSFSLGIGFGPYGHHGWR